MPSPSTALATLRPDLGGSFEEFDLAMDRQGFIATRVLPVLEVAKASGVFGKIPIEQLLKVRALQIRAQIETMLLVAAGQEVGPRPHHIVSAASLLHVPHHRPPIGGAIHHLQCPQCPGLIEASRFAEHLEFHVNEVLFYLRIYRIDISLSL